MNDSRLPSVFSIGLLVVVVGIIVFAISSSRQSSQDTVKPIPHEATVQTEDAVKPSYSQPSSSTEYPDKTQANCNIKGNISYETSEKIYHTPDQEFYDETVINERYGERWFCSEQDAIDAGWRKSRT